MPKYVHTNLLCIGGLQFHFSESIQWPDAGPLASYHPFLSRPSVPAAAPDIIKVRLKAGLSRHEDDICNLVESGSGIRWFRAGGAHVVESLLPHISPDPLWAIEMKIDEQEATLCLSDLYMEKEKRIERWPVAVPRYPRDQHMAMHFLPGLRGALIHAAGGCHSGRGFLCAGKSGAGKTTISRVISERGGIDLLTDDRVITRRGPDGAFTVHGTPWTGEGQYATAGTAPLNAIFFLHKDSENRVEQLSTVETFERFMPVTTVPWFDQDLVTGALAHVEELSRVIPAYDLHFARDQGAAELIADTVMKVV